jgi:hypothetical protein
MVRLIPNHGPVREGNDCHTPEGAGGGQFCGTAASRGRVAPDLVAKMRDKFLPTTDRLKTRFLLPDGTRMTFNLAGDARWQGRPFATTHEMAATVLGVRPADVFAARVVRYLPKEGINAGSKITSAQADVIAGDWAIYQTRLHIDVSTGSNGMISSPLKVLDHEDVTASRVQAMVNNRFQ